MLQRKLASHFLWLEKQYPAKLQEFGLKNGAKFEILSQASTARALSRHIAGEGREIIRYLCVNYSCLEKALRCPIR
jgi:hypothetical protein